MANEPIDLEMIVTIQSAKALSTFADYIQSLDRSLTKVDAMALAASVIGALPDLSENNPALKDMLAEVINMLKAAKSKKGKQ